MENDQSRQLILESIQKAFASSNQGGEAKGDKTTNLILRYAGEFQLELPSDQMSLLLFFAFLLSHLEHQAESPEIDAVRRLQMSNLCFVIKMAISVI